MAKRKMKSWQTPPKPEDFKPSPGAPPCRPLDFAKRGGDGFAMVPSVFFEHGAYYLTPSAQIIFLALCYFRNTKTGAIHPALTTIMRHTGIKRVTVWRAIEELIKAGWIRRLKKWKSNHYQICIPLEFSQGIEKHPDKQVSQGTKMKPESGSCQGTKMKPHQGTKMKRETGTKMKRDKRTTSFENYKNIEQQQETNSDVDEFPYLLLRRIGLNKQTCEEMKEKPVDLLWGQLCFTADRLRSSSGIANPLGFLLSGVKTARGLPEGFQCPPLPTVGELRLLPEWRRIRPRSDSAWLQDIARAARDGGIAAAFEKDQREAADLAEWRKRRKVDS